MRGFFSQEAVSLSRAARKGGKACGVCRLSRSCSSPCMAPTGEGRKGILFVAEAPGQDEDRHNTQLVGEAGQLHRDICRELGIDLDRDCRKTNALACRPPKNRKPTPEEVGACRSMVWEEIKTHPPKLIVALGETALESLIGDRWAGSIEGVGRWRGFCWPDGRARSWMFSTYHPSYIAREEDHNPAVRLIYRQDLQSALSYLSRPLPRLPSLDEDKRAVRLLYDPAAICSFLREFNRTPPPVVSFDYETTGKKPYRPEQDVVCASLAYAEDKAVAFPLSAQPASGVLSQIQDEWRFFLKNPRVRKVAHNLKFEEVWSQVKFGVRVAGWWHDPMIGARLLDNRRQIAGLDFQAAVQLGIFGYDQEVSPFLTSPLNNQELLWGANSLNRVRSLNIAKLLVYCGLDSLYTYRLAKMQRGLIWA